MATGDPVYLCAVYDKQAMSILGGVFECRTKGEAIRMFSDGVNHKGEKQSLLQMHPGDFQLVQLGVFDRSSCRVEGVFEVLIEGSEVRNGAESADA